MLSDFDKFGIKILVLFNRFIWGKTIIEIWNFNHCFTSNESTEKDENFDTKFVKIGQCLLLLLPCQSLEIMLRSTLWQRQKYGLMLSDFNNFGAKTFLSTYRIGQIHNFLRKLSDSKNMKSNSKIIVKNTKTQIWHLNFLLITKIYHWRQ